MSDERKKLDPVVKRKIKRRLDAAAKKIEEAYWLLQDAGFEDGYIFCEGSGRIHAIRDYDSRSEGVLVTSEQSHFDAGGW